METGHYIALALVIISIIALIVVIFQAKKKIAPTMELINDLKLNIDKQKAHFSEEADHIQREVNHLSKRVEALQPNIELKQKQFAHFRENQNEFQSQIAYLKEVAPKYAQHQGETMARDIKRDIPKITQIMRLAVKKTITKQKTRRDQQSRKD